MVLRRERKPSVKVREKDYNARLKFIHSSANKFAEHDIISLRIPCMKMVALSSGKLCAIHGPAVNVTTDLQLVCSLLPRLPSQAQVVPR